MKKIFTLLFFAILWCVQIRAQHVALVDEFMETLSNWSNNNNVQEMVKLDKLCSEKPSFRAADNFMQFLARKYELATANSYSVNDFLFCCQKAIDEGCLIKHSNIIQIPDSTVSELFPNIKYPNLTWYRCDIETYGPLEFKDTVVFIILNEKIVKTCSLAQPIK